MGDNNLIQRGTTEQSKRPPRRMLPGTQPAVRVADRAAIERKQLIREVLRGQWTRDELNAMLSCIREFSAEADGTSEPVIAALKAQGHIKLSEKVQKQTSAVRLAIEMWASDMWRTNDLGQWKLELADLARGTTRTNLQRQLADK